MFKSICSPMFKGIAHTSSITGISDAPTYSLEFNGVDSYGAFPDMVLDGDYEISYKTASYSSNSGLPDGSPATHPGGVVVISGIGPRTENELGRNDAAYYNGAILDLSIKDLSKPIQNQYAVKGNGSLYVKLPDIPIESGDTIEFNFIPYDDSNFRYFYSCVPRSGNPHLTTALGTYRYQSSDFQEIFLNGKPIGASGVEPVINGVQASVKIISKKSAIVRWLHASENDSSPGFTRFMGLHIISDFKVTTANGTYHYDLSGENGTVVPNIDPITGNDPATNGKWFNYDEQTDQQFLPQVDRFYPIKSKNRDTQPDTLGDGSTDMTLFNVDHDNDWIETSDINVSVTDIILEAIIFLEGQGWTIANTILDKSFEVSDVDVTITKEQLLSNDIEGLPSPLKNDIKDFLDSYLT